LRRLMKLFGGLVALCVVFAIYMGMFRSITVQESEEGPFVFVYEEMRGTDIRDVGKITTELHGFLTAAGVAEMKPFDLFQPPNSGKPHEIGFVVSEADLQRLLARNNSIASRVIPRQLYMKAEFPFRNRLSFVVGYVKVDPALAAYRTAHGLASAPAIARNDGDVITYLQPVVKNAGSKN